MCDLSRILVLGSLNFNDSVENYVGQDGVFIAYLISTWGFLVYVKSFLDLYPALRWLFKS
jgi:hypothetical protein